MKQNSKPSEASAPQAEILTLPKRRRKARREGRTTTAPVLSMAEFRERRANRHPQPAVPQYYPGAGLYWVWMPMMWRIS